MRLGRDARLNADLCIPNPLGGERPDVGKYESRGRVVVRVAVEVVLQGQTETDVIGAPGITPCRDFERVGCFTLHAIVDRFEIAATKERRDGCIDTVHIEISRSKATLNEALVAHRRLGNANAFDLRRPLSSCGARSQPRVITIGIRCQGRQS